MLQAHCYDRHGWSPARDRLACLHCRYQVRFHECHPCLPQLYPYESIGDQLDCWILQRPADYIQVLPSPQGQSNSSDFPSRSQRYLAPLRAQSDHSANNDPPQGHTPAGSCRTTHSHPSPVGPGIAAPTRMPRHRRPDRRWESGCQILRSCCSTPRSRHSAPGRSQRAVCQVI